MYSSCKRGYNVLHRLNRMVDSKHTSIGKAGVLALRALHTTSCYCQDTLSTKASKLIPIASKDFRLVNKQTQARVLSHTHTHKIGYMGGTCSMVWDARQDPHGSTSVCVESQSF